MLLRPGRIWVLLSFGRRDNERYIAPAGLEYATARGLLATPGAADENHSEKPTPSTTYLLFILPGLWEYRTSVVA